MIGIPYNSNQSIFQIPKHMNVLGENLRPTADLHPLHPFRAPGWSFDADKQICVKTIIYLCHERRAPVNMYNKYLNLFRTEFAMK